MTKCCSLIVGFFCCSDVISPLGTSFRFLSGRIVVPHENDKIVVTEYHRELYENYLKQFFDMGLSIDNDKAIQKLI